VYRSTSGWMPARTLLPTRRRFSHHTHVRPKGDVNVPWPQDPPFFAALDATAHVGGILYWTQGDHVMGESPWDSGLFPEWTSEEEYEDWIYQFVRNQSYPAISRFSLNGNPGNGNPRTATCAAVSTASRAGIPPPWLTRRAAGR